MFNLHKFKEKIDTEFPDGNSMLSIQAIKTDAGSNSLKAALDLNCIKTCDYIRFKGSSTLVLIECSDLDRQSADLEDDLLNLIDMSSKMGDRALKKIAHKVRKQHRVAVDTVIFDELKIKYKDTLLLINKITDKTDLNFTQRFNKKEFIIITNKLEANNPTESIALDQFRRTLTSDLKTGLACVVDDVRVLTPQRFLNDF